MTPEAYAGLKPLLDAGVLHVVDRCTLGGAWWDVLQNELQMWSEVRILQGAGRASALLRFMLVQV
jgi:hypothetical protein